MELFRQFEWFLRHECRAEVHQALAVAPAVVFDMYFDRKPPFDGEDSKEFPDGFVVEALKQWCREQSDRMHVVTEDKAMTRAASADDHLIPLKDIHEVLARAAADLGAAGESAAEAAISEAAFDSSLEAALRAQMKEVVYVYVGELAEGEAYEGELLSIEEVGDWSVVGLSDHRVTLILDAKVKVRVEVQYENRDDAIYDREDDRWFGAEIASTEVDDEIDIEILVEVERQTGTVREAKVLTQEVSIYGPSEFEY
jgi:PIN domain